MNKRVLRGRYEAEFEHGPIAMPCKGIVVGQEQKALVGDQLKTAADAEPRPPVDHFINCAPLDISIHQGSALI